MRNYRSSEPPWADSRRERSRPPSIYWVVVKELKALKLSYHNMGI